MLLALLFLEASVISCLLLHHVAGHYRSRHAYREAVRG